MQRSTVLFLGGLGNQLFQYAFMVYLEKIKGAKCLYNTSYHKHFNVHSGFQANLFFDFSPYEESQTNYYSIPFRLEKKFRNVLNIKKSLLTCDDKHFQENKLSKSYEGYWQDIRFYSAVKDILKERFLGIDQYCASPALLSDIRKENSVFLHIRRGDYCKDPAYVNLCATDYYQNAIAYLRQKLSSPKFFVFSDDISWSRSFLEKETDMTFVSYEGQSPLGDLALMLHAKHAIIANSSFSWWGTAFDSKDFVVYPTSYYTSGDACPLYFDSWTKITPSPL